MNDDADTQTNSSNSISPIDTPQAESNTSNIGLVAKKIIQPSESFKNEIHSNQQQASQPLVSTPQGTQP